MKEEKKTADDFKEISAEEAKRQEREALRKKIRQSSPWLTIKSN